MHNDILGWWIADKPYLKVTQVTKKTHFTNDGEGYREGTYRNKIDDDTFEMCYQGNYVRVFRHQGDAKNHVIQKVSGEYADEFIENIMKFGDSKFSEIYERKGNIAQQKRIDEQKLQAYLLAEADGFRRSQEEYWFAAYRFIEKQKLLKELYTWGNNVPKQCLQYIKDVESVDIYGNDNTAWSNNSY